MINRMRSIHTEPEEGNRYLPSDRRALPAKFIHQFSYTLQFVAKVRGSKVEPVFIRVFHLHG